MTGILERRTPNGTQLRFAGTIEGVAWGLFFIWVGLAFLANVSWGAGLLGVGILTLGAQAARKYVGLRVESFWLVIGVVWLVWGLSELLIEAGAVSLPGGSFPILLVAVGIALVTSALLRAR